MIFKSLKLTYFLQYLHCILMHKFFLKKSKPCLKDIVFVGQGSNNHCWKLFLKKNQYSSQCTLLNTSNHSIAWWRHQMETFSTLLALCAGNSPVTGEFPSQRPVMQNFVVFFELRLNTRLSKQSGHRWFETQSHSLWCHCNGCVVKMLTDRVHVVRIISIICIGMKTIGKYTTCQK